MEPAFCCYFNRRRQWFDVYLEDVTQWTFYQHGGGRWGYWWCPRPRRARVGWFGEMHLVASKLRPDTVVHEIMHLTCDWTRSGKTPHINSRNEERAALLMDELFRSFYREYEKQ